jgi:hypothetical protein
MKLAIRGVVKMNREPNGGRPVTGDTRGSTKMTRVYDDIYDMIYWICQAEGITSAELLDPFIRAQLQARRMENDATIQVLKRARQARRTQAAGGTGESAE